MIALLTGTLRSVTDEALIVEVHGIGYRVLAPLHTLQSSLALIGQDITLHTSLQVSTDALRLYGFLHPSEEELFELLITVDRVGPKAALAMLGTGSWEELATAIRSGNSAALALTPGVGKKTAERIILDLRDKLAAFAVSQSGTIQQTVLPGDVSSQAIVALTSLGFNEREAHAAIEAVLKETNGKHQAVNDLVSNALRRLGAGVAHHD